MSTILLEFFHKNSKRKITSPTETYTPVDLSIKASDTAMPIDEIRKVLWEDYDPTEIYGSKFIVPVRGYFCRLYFENYQASPRNQPLNSSSFQLISREYCQQFDYIFLKN